MSPLPPQETNTLERELNFLKQTIGTLREQMERNLDLHDAELQSLEKKFSEKESSFQRIITELRADYEQLSSKQQFERE